VGDSGEFEPVTSVSLSSGLVPIKSSKRAESRDSADMRSNRPDALLANLSISFLSFLSSRAFFSCSKRSPS